MSARAITFAAVACLAVASAAAQDRTGRDTPGEWRVTHFKQYGLWDSMCDERVSANTLEERCYVRYVEVYSPNPQFGAAFSFIVPEGREGAVTAEFGFERGIRFKKDGIRIEAGGETARVLDQSDCRRGGKCTLDSKAMADIEQLAATAPNTTFAFSLTGRHGRDWELRWLSDRLHMAIDDMRAEARERALID